MSYQAQDFAVLQLELINTKVEMAASNAMTMVIEQIRALKDEMHGMRAEIKDEMHEMRIEISTRLIAVETKLGMVNTRQDKIFDRLLDYTFKTGWIIASIITSYVLLRFHVNLT